MRERERVREQLERAWAGPAWHGPAVRELLEGVDAARAAARPLAGRHSIWEIVLHMTTWVEAGCLRMTGGRWDPAPDEDWPPVTDTSGPAWEKALARLEGAHQALLNLLGVLDEARLDEPVAGCEYTVGFLLHGVVQHDLYHVGQIALLQSA